MKSPQATDAENLRHCVERLSAHPDFRVLQRIVPVSNFSPARPAAGELFIGAVVDVETTGLDPRAESIIELAIQRFRYDSLGQIVEVGVPRVWMEDPKCPLDPFTTKLTGLTDADLKDQSIEDTEAITLLSSANVIVAHNASFDRPFIESRLPMIKGKAWGCSLVDLDWFALGFEGRKLSHLLSECGWFYEGHRAENDVLAVLYLLAHQTQDGETVLKKLLECAQRPTWRVTALKAAFNCKDALKSRGYRWDAFNRTWWKDVPDCDLAEEKAWLAEEVYNSTCEAAVQEITWLNRYSG